MRPSSSQPVDDRGAAIERATLHAVTWLVLGNAVGIWLAVLLLLPEAGAATGVLTFGRWMPLHLNIQLFGWSSLPLVALLMALYVPTRGAVPARRAIDLWSATLAAGCVVWAAGQVTGKLYLDWVGGARILLMINLSFLAFALWQALWRSRHTADARAGHVGWWLKAVALVPMSLVPVLLWLGTDPSTFQAINPETGGGTGTNVAASALGTVVLFFVLPWLVGLRSDNGGRVARSVGLILFLHWAWVGSLDMGDRAHFELDQALAVLSVWIWPPLMAWHLWHFDFSPVCRRWLKVAGVWAVLLMATGSTAFLPGHMAGWKFTNALVGHAHLAMAGLLTSLLVLILQGVNRGGPLREIFAGRRPFYAWHGALALHIAVLTWVGYLESQSPSILYSVDARVQLGYGLRLAAGLVMAGASLAWLRSTARALAGELDPVGAAPSKRSPSVHSAPTASCGAWAVAPRRRLDRRATSHAVALEDSVLREVSR